MHDASPKSAPAPRYIWRWLLPGIVLAAALVAAVLVLGDGDAPQPQHREPFTVALTGKYPPFSFYDSEGELAGFDVDVAHAIAERLGRPLKIVATEWDGILAGLLASKYDAIIGSMAVTPQRAEQVDFSTPYYVSGAQLFVHEGAGDVTLADCTGKPVGVVLGETFQHYLEANHPEIDVRTYKSSVDIFQEMQNGNLFGFVTDRLVGAWQIKNAEMPFKPAGELLYTERMAIPVLPENDELLAQINAALADMESTGRRDRLFDRWFGLGGQNAGGGEGMQRSTIVSMLARGFAVTLGVAASSLAIGFLLAVPFGAVLHRGRGGAYLVVRAFTDFIRGTPVLIQLFFVYFGLGSVEFALGGRTFDLGTSPLVASVITLAINATAYMAEVVRSGLMSVDRGQVLAGRALGLSRLQVFRVIVWPQAFRIAVPPLMNSVVALIKDTALVSVISVAEVVRQAQSVISVTWEPSKYYLIVAVMFFAVTFPLMKLTALLERRLRQRGFTHD